MIVNILPGPVLRQDQMPSVLSALTGKWGSEGGTSYMGRVSLNFTAGPSIPNPTKVPGLFMGDGSSGPIIKTVPPGGIILSEDCQAGILILQEQT